MATTVYMACAAIGGAVLIIQMFLLLIGGDIDADMDMDMDMDIDDADAGDGSFSLLSIRAVTGFLTFFGLVGWWGSVEGWGQTKTLLAALGSGLVMMVAIAWLFSLQRRLHSEGNVDFRNVVGLTGKVYLRIPGHKTGNGKITVAIQGRSMEFLALTSGEEIPTGSDIRVVAMTTEGTYEVEPLDGHGG